MTAVPASAPLRIFLFMCMSLPASPEGAGGAAVAADFLFA
jgi:hypothetical protein